MSKTIGNFWFSEINLQKLTSSEEGILGDICKLYSESFGVWLSNESRITLSPKRFLSLHKSEIVYFVADTSGSILGFACVSTRKSNLKVITSICVDKRSRNLGIGRSIIKYILSQVNSGTWRIGIVSANPVALLTLEGYPGLEYIDLEEEVKKDPSFGIHLSVFIDEFRRKSCGDNYKRASKISYRKIQTEFYVDIPFDEIQDGLNEFYKNLMGPLEPGEEWILFCKYES